MSYDKITTLEGSVIAKTRDSDQALLGTALICLSARDRPSYRAPLNRLRDNPSKRAAHISNFSRTGLFPCVDKGHEGQLVAVKTCREVREEYYQ